MQPNQDSADTGSQEGSISLPDAGLSSGYGDAYATDPQKGSPGYSIPLPLTQARTGTPDSSLTYSGGGGNSVFGIGFSLEVMEISRRTDLGVPRYDDSDLFLLGGDTLVPAYKKDQSGEWKLMVRTATFTDNGGQTKCQVHQYRREVESSFDRIEWWIPENGEGSFWQVTDSENSTYLLGHSALGRIANPANSQQEFAWKLEKTTDARGNRVLYQYLAENDVGLPDPGINPARDRRANRYLSQILYANYLGPTGKEEFGLRLILNYGQYTLSDASLPLKADRKWAHRPDPFSTYKAGFEVRTWRRCQSVLMVHNYPNEIGAPNCLVAAMTCDYGDDATCKTGSYLRQVQRIGYSPNSVGTGYDRMDLPEIILGYTPYDPQKSTSGKLDVAGGPPIQGRLEGGLLRLTDLFGEGAPGVFYAKGENRWYWPPLGGGCYGSAVSLPQAPNSLDPSHPDIALIDQEGAGFLDVVIERNDGAGYFANLANGDWAPFQTFSRFPNGIEAGERLDLTGDGLGDLYDPTDSAVRYFPSNGRDGFGDPQLAPKTTNVPLVGWQNARTRVGFSDLFGDGLSARYVLGSGQLTAWPSTGNGQFAPPVEFVGVPEFGADLTTDRVLFADLNGTGLPDLILVHSDRIETCLNACGNGFSAPQSISLPIRVTDADSVFFADVFGNGGSVLVISKPTPGGGQYWLDLTAGQRPGLLNEIDNGTGVVTTLCYRSSTDFFLAARTAGDPWTTNLPNPVNVVHKMIKADLLTGVRMVNVSEYRDGYYDPVERKFEGFGYVQSQDTETYGVTNWLFAQQRCKGAPVVGPPQSVPAQARSWAQVGSLTQQEKLDTAVAARCFSRDPDALALATSWFGPGVGDGSASIQSQALRALAGATFRQEVYAVAEDGDAANVPISTKQKQNAIRLVQPPLDGHRAVFTVYDRQDATSFYEGFANDPLVTQTIALEVDAYSQLTLQAVIAYGRRQLPAGAPPGQQEMLVTLNRHHVTNVIEPFHRIGIRYETETFDVKGIAPKTGLYFQFSDCFAAVALALQTILPYGTSFTGKVPQALRSFWTTKLFWNAGLSAPLPLGHLTAEALEYHDLTAVFPQTLVDAIYDTSLVTSKLLENTGGYIWDADSASWWEPTQTQYFHDASKFWLLEKTTDPFGNVTTFGYDPSWQVIVAETDALGQVTTADLDYVTLQIWQVTDINNIITQVAFDPLAMVSVSTLFAPVGQDVAGTAPLSDYVAQPAADFSHILTNPQTYLQKAGAFYAYDPWAWRLHGLPVQALTLRQVDWIFDGAGKPVAATQTQSELEFVDGFGRTLASALAVDRDAIALSDQPPTQPSDGPLLWLMQDGTVYSDRGEPVRKYLPYASSQPIWDPAPNSYEMLYYYDAAGRQIGTLAPDEARTKTHRTAWSETHEDQNDCDVKSPDFGTGSTSFTDARGYPIQETQINRDGPGDPTYALNSVLVVDFAGNNLRVADPRFYDPKKPAEPRHFNFENTFAMTGALMRSISVDAGTSETLTDALDSVIEHWEAGGARTSTRYDALGRETTQMVVDPGTYKKRLVSKITYGTNVSARNCGLPEILQDQAGIKKLPIYDLLSNPVEVISQVLQDYETPVDWNAATVPLVPTVWRQTWERDALGAIRQELRADGSTQIFDVYQTGWLKTLKLKPPEGKSAKTIVSGLTYNAASSRRTALMGNGVAIEEDYDPKTERLVRQSITGPGAKAPLLQSLSYEYDLVGNLLTQSDAAQTASPARSFNYDAIYRLVKASGQMQSAGTTQDYVQRYSYDFAGNMLRLRQVAKGASFTRKFTVSKGSNHAVPTAMLSAGQSPDTYYDPAGNLTALQQQPEPELALLTYDERSKLAMASIIPRAASGPDAAWFLYDKEGLRTRKIVQRLTSSSTLITDTIYVGGCVFERNYSKGKAPTAQLAELSIDAGGTLTLVSGIVQKLDSKGVPEPDPAATRSWRYQGTNIVNSVVLETGPIGEVTTYAEYFPFGDIAISDGKAVDIKTKRYRYTGHERDSATGLYIMGQRYYASFMCRWMSPDPSGTVDRINLYIYADNNPTTKFDNTGRDPLTAQQKAAFILQINEQYRYLTPAEATLYREIAQDIKQEIHTVSTLYSDENARFSSALEAKIVSAFNTFSGMFMFNNPVLATMWDEAKSRLTNPSTSGDTRHDYTLVRSHLNNVVKEWVPKADLGTGFIRSFETHHLEPKAKYPGLGTETYNMAFSTRGSFGKGLIGTHEGLFHMLTAGNMGNIYQYEVSAVTGIIKRATANTLGLDISDPMELSGSSVGWLELQDRSAGKTVPIWSVAKAKKRKQRFDKRSTAMLSLSVPTNAGIFKPARQTQLQKQMKSYQIVQRFKPY